MNQQSKVNLLDFDRKALETFLVEQGAASYRAKQIMKWIHFCGKSDFDTMTDLGKALRQQLTECAEISAPTVSYHQKSSDGTQKWVLRLQDGNCIETVFIPEKKRGTLCVSSQVGCALNCQFCSTAQQGFSRNLTVGEIIGQVWLAVRQLSLTDGMHDRQVTNVVMMGMGEPLLNFDAVVSAMDIMMDDFGYGLSKRRVTLSTSGVVPAMLELGKVSGAALAVSLHAPNDDLRNQLVPINKKYSLKELMSVCKNYFKDEPRRKVTFEYVMLKDVNDTPQHAKQLIKILNGVPAKVNLIPFNPFPNTHFECSPRDIIEQFLQILQKSNICVTVRKTRGDDIDGACGQLVGKVNDRTKRSIRLLANQKKIAIPVMQESLLS